MQTRLIDLNCKEKNYEFNISVVTENDWKNFVYSVVLEKGEYIGNLEIKGFKVVIRDNKAKVKIFYQSNDYHEVEYHLDEFGRSSMNCCDNVSSIWQDVMLKYYGKKYDDARRMTHEDGQIIN